MTGNEWFAFVIWPLVVLAMCGGVVVVLPWLNRHGL